MTSRRKMTQYGQHRLLTFRCQNARKRCPAVAHRLLLTIAFLILPASCLASEVEVKVGNRSPQVGEPFKVQIEVRCDIDAMVRFPEQSSASTRDRLGPFHVIEWTDQPPRLDDGSIVYTRQWTLEAWRGGSLTIPPILVGIESSGASGKVREPNAADVTVSTDAIRTVQSQPATVQVTSQWNDAELAGGIDGAMVRPIRPAVALPSQYRVSRWPAMAVATVVIAVAATVAVAVGWTWRRRSRETWPRRWAARRLRKLRQKGSDNGKVGDVDTGDVDTGDVDAGDVDARDEAAEQHLSEAILILRDYLEARTGIDTTHRPTTHWLASLEADGRLGDEQLRHLRQWCLLNDKCQFAGGRIDPKKWRRWIGKGTGSGKQASDQGELLGWLAAVDRQLQQTSAAKDVQGVYR